MKFYGQFDPPVDRFIFERYFPDDQIRGTFVECGAFDGLLESSCKFFEETMGWSGYNLEPVPWIFEKLCQNRPASRNLNVGLSDRTGTSAFNTVIHPQLGRGIGWGTIDSAPDHLAEIRASGAEVEASEITVLSWNDFISQEGIEQIDLMVLDVEGHELSVLSGMRGSPVLPKVMCVEFGHAGFGGIRNEMDRLGYEYDTNSHANAFFVKREVLGVINLRQQAMRHPANDGSLLARMKSVETEVSHLSAAVTELRDMHAKAGDLATRVDFLQKRETELVVLHDSIVNSRSWRLIELTRRLLGRR
jgi:FkbM family methyltransferase